MIVALFFSAVLILFSSTSNGFKFDHFEINQIDSEALYSVQLFNRNNAEISVNFEIIVSGTVLTGSGTVPPGATPWQNFGATETDSIDVVSFTNSFFDFYYLINNGPNGGGNTFYDSRSTTFRPINLCDESSCAFDIRNFISQWGNSTANVYVNNELVIENYNGVGMSPFNAGKDDAIRVDFTFGGGVETQVAYGIQVSSSPILWLYDSYGSGAVVQRYIAPVLPDKSPTGGRIYPITQEQASNFAILLGAGNTNNNRWNWITI